MRGDCLSDIQSPLHSLIARSSRVAHMKEQIAELEDKIWIVEHEMVGLLVEH